MIYSQGIMDDGPVILKDGKPMTPDDIVSELNAYRLIIRATSKAMFKGTKAENRAVIKLITQGDEE